MKILKLLCLSPALLLAGSIAHADLATLVRECILGMSQADISAAEECSTAQAKAEGIKEGKAEAKPDAKTEVKAESDDDDETDIDACTPLSTLMGPTLAKNRVSGSSDTVIMMACQGDQAKALYEAVRFYGKELGPRENDTHYKYVVRFFGNLQVPSQCMRFFQAANGSSMDAYSCSVGVDLNSAVVKAW